MAGTTVGILFFSSVMLNRICCTMNSIMDIVKCLERKPNWIFGMIPFFNIILRIISSKSFPIKRNRFVQSRLFILYFHIEGKYDNLVAFYFRYIDTYNKNNKITPTYLHDMHGLNSKLDLDVYRAGYTLQLFMILISQLQVHRVYRYTLICTRC